MAEKEGNCRVKDTSVMLSELPFWKYLSEMERQDLLTASYCRHFESGTVVYDPEEEKLGLFCVMTGLIRAFILSEEGREITLYRLRQEDVCALCDCGAIAQTGLETHLIAERETDILIVPPEAISYMADRNIYVQCFVYELTAQRLSEITSVFQQILFARFDQRLASFLVEECRRSGSAEISMTQEQIAGYVNSAREVVARMLRQFSIEGLVETRRGVTLLKDIPALEKRSGICELQDSLTKSS